MKQETAAAVAMEPALPPANAPLFVDAEKMLDRVAELTKETSQRAYDYFMARGTDWTTHFDDWLKAEMEILRPAPIEITETAETLNVRAAVPGFKPEEIEISIKDQTLMLSGETGFEEKREDEKIFLNEWQSNRFCRQVWLPSEVETEGVSAQLKDGILHLALKKKAAEEAAKIAVNAA